MGHKSKEKGKRGELELAAELRRVLGIEARRGVQYQGGQGSPDVVADLPGVHIEVKRCERLSLYSAMKQASADAGADKVPVVCHRANHQDWIVIVRLDDLPRLAMALSNR